VRAAHAAAVLVAAGARRGLFVVGTCGALRAPLAPGDLVHCTHAAQVDLGVLDGRKVAADAALLAVWRALVPGPAAAFLTADRAVLSPWRRLRTARAWSGPCVVDMETAAAALVARTAGVPWAALRAVTDRAGAGALAGFRASFRTQAGRAADSLAGLIERLEAPSVAAPSGPG
jgi:nucleoside phosphorylase